MKLQWLKKKRSKKAQPYGDGVQKFKTIVGYSVLGLGATWITVALATNIIRRMRRNNLSKHSLEDGHAANYAQMLHMAFKNDNWFGWGTKTQAVMDIFKRIPNKKMLDKVKKAYQGIYNKPLALDLENELSVKEYTKVMEITRNKV